MWRRQRERDDRTTKNWDRGGWRGENKKNEDGGSDLEGKARWRDEGEIEDVGRHRKKDEWDKTKPKLGKSMVLEAGGERRKIDCRETK